MTICNATIYDIGVDHAGLNDDKKLYVSQKFFDLIVPEFLL